MDIGATNNLQEKIEFPVRYDNKQQAIWDSKGMMVCDIREWRRNQLMGTSENHQDLIGEKVAKLMNEYQGRPKKTNAPSSLASKALYG